MLVVLSAILSLTAPSFADVFETRIIVASKSEHLALVSLANRDLLAFAECALPAYFDDATTAVPMETVLNCRQLGAFLPNTPNARFALESHFKVALADRIRDRNGPQAAFLVSVPLGALAGSIVGSLAYIVSTNAWVGVGSFLGTVVTTGLGAMIANGFRKGTHAAASSVLFQVQKSAPLTLSQTPLVVDDIDGYGSKDGFGVARATLVEAVRRTAKEIVGITPGGGSAGGAGSTGTW